MVFASVSSAIRSVTAGPIRCAPTSAPVSACHSVLTKPVVSPAARAFASAENGNRPTLTGMFAALAFSSVRPSDAIYGEQYVHAGIAS